MRTVWSCRLKSGERVSVLVRPSERWLDGLVSGWEASHGLQKGWGETEQEAIDHLLASLDAGEGGSYEPAR